MLSSCEHFMTNFTRKIFLLQLKVNLFQVCRCTLRDFTHMLSFEVISQLRFVEESFRAVLALMGLQFLVDSLNVCVISAVLIENLAAVTMPGSFHSRMFRPFVCPH